MIKIITLILLLLVSVNSQDLFAQQQKKDTIQTNSTNGITKIKNNNYSEELKLNKEDLSLMYKAFDAQSNRSYNLLMYLTILIGLFSFLGFIIQYKYGSEQKAQLKETIKSIEKQSEQTINQALQTLEISKNITSSANEILQKANNDINKIEKKLDELITLQSKIEIEQKRLVEFDDSVKKRLDEMKPSKEIEKQVIGIVVKDVKNRYKYPVDLKKEWLDDIKIEVEKIMAEINKLKNKQG